MIIVLRKLVEMPQKVKCDVNRCKIIDLPEAMAYKNLTAEIAERREKAIVRLRRNGQRILFLCVLCVLVNLEKPAMRNRIYEKIHLAG
jgi:hypothetical protein